MSGLAVDTVKSVYYIVKEFHRIIKPFYGTFKNLCFTIIVILIQLLSLNLLKLEFYEASDFNGRCIEYSFSTFPDVWYLNTIDLAQLSVKFDNKISSIRIDNKNSQSNVIVILFEHKDFEGDFVAYNIEPSTYFEDISIGSLLDNKVSSIYVIGVKNGYETMIDSSKLTIKQSIIDFVKNIQKVNLRQNPVITWKIDYSLIWRQIYPNKHQCFLKIIIPVEYEFFSFLTPDVDIELIIRPNIDNGNIVFNKACTSYKLGFFKGLLGLLVRRYIRISFEEIITEIENILEDIENFYNIWSPYEYIYLLPGDSTCYSPTNNRNEGHTNDGSLMMLVT
jgi:hypothetical protein